MKIVPVRGLLSGFELTVYVTVPLPVPLARVKEIQGVVDMAAHCVDEQDAGSVTSKAPDPPSPPHSPCPGEMLTRQGAEAGGCTMVDRRPPMAMVPTRQS